MRATSKMELPLPAKSRLDPAWYPDDRAEVTLPSGYNGDRSLPWRELAFGTHAKVRDD